MTDIDSALRTMLRDRAQDIGTVPARIGRFETRPETQYSKIEPCAERQPRPRRTGWLVAAAVAAVLAIAGMVIAVGHDGGHHSTPPATHVPSPSPAPSLSTSHIQRSVSPTPTPSVIDGVHAPACPSRLPDPFANVLKPVLTTTASGGYDLAGLPILSVTPNGDVLAGTEGDTHFPARLDMIRPDGARTTLYRTTDIPLDANEGARVSAAKGDARWVVFAVSVGQQGQQNLMRLGIVDRASGNVRTFRSLPANNPTTILPPVLYQGRAYWSEIYDTGTGTVFTYNPSTGRTETLASGTAVGAPSVIGGGLYWQLDGRVITYRPGMLPIEFPPSTVKFPPFASDGITTVWTTAANINGRIHVLLELSRPGMNVPLTLVDSTTADTIIPLAVTGPYVFWSDQAFTALDTRTGATAQVGDSSPGFSTIAADGGTIAVNQIGSKGGAQLSIARIASLPELSC